MAVRELCQGCRAPVGSENLVNHLCNYCSQQNERIDMVNHPPHYNSGDAKCECDRRIECIDVTRHMDFNIGNAVKYLWRYKHKNGVEDLKKAVWYIQDEIKQMEKNNGGD